MRFEEIIANYDIVQAFGLGFIQFKMKNGKRFHFYDKMFKTVDDDIHNHRYDFKSTIIKGTLKETLYDISGKPIPNSKLLHCKETDCQNGNIPLKLPDMYASVISTLTHHKNSTYIRNVYEYHTVESDYCVTMLELGERILDRAYVLYSKEEDLLNCPFLINKKYSNSELLKIAEEIWNKEN